METIPTMNIIRRILLTTILTLCVTAHADRVLNEGFDYPIGESLDNQGKWSASEGRKLVVTEGSLSYAKLKTSGNKVTIDSSAYTTEGTYKRTFVPLELSAAGDTLYFSFLTHIRNTGGENSALEIDLGMASLISTANSSAERGFYPRMNSKGDVVKLPDGTSLIVGKLVRDPFDIEYGQLFLWLNPEPSSIGGLELNEPSIKTKNTYRGTESWSTWELKLTLRGASATGTGMGGCADLDLDELRIGTSWADVTPVPEKQPRKLFGLGLLLFLLVSVPEKE